MSEPVHVFMYPVRRLPDFDMLKWNDIVSDGWDLFRVGAVAGGVGIRRNGVMLIAGSWEELLLVYTAMEAGSGPPDDSYEE